MFVVDANVFIKSWGGEPGWENALQWLESTRRAGTLLRGPTLLGYELANAMQGRLRDKTPADRAAALTTALLGIRLEEPIPEQTFGIGGLTYYDASYVEIARRRGATLVTADKPMAAATKRLGIAVKIL